ncbi:MAG TPA: hypothetical protein PKK40_03950 [Marmoricola sp.]|nr:hypothetical protein [Marmoricola sp.]
MTAADHRRHPHTHSGPINRRNLMVGAAWAVPSVLAASAAPAMAASTVCPNVSFSALWDPGTSKLSILLNNNDANALPSGGVVYATVSSDYGQSVTMAAGGAVQIDGSDPATFSPTAAATVPGPGSVRWRFLMPNPIPSGAYASLIFTPTVQVDWYIRLIFGYPDCPPVQMCYSGLGLVGMAPGTYCTPPGPS